MIWRQGTLTFFTGATARCSHTHAAFFFSLQFIRLFLAAEIDTYYIPTGSLLVGSEFWSCSFQRSKGKRQFVPLLFASTPTKRTLLPYFVAAIQRSIPQKFRYPVVFSSFALITEKITRECHLNHKVTRTATPITKRLQNSDFEAATAAAVILIGDHRWHRID